MPLEKSGIASCVDCIRQADSVLLHGWMKSAGNKCYFFSNYIYLRTQCQDTPVPAFFKTIIIRTFLKLRFFIKLFILLYTLYILLRRGGRVQLCDCKRDWLSVLLPLEEIKYLFKCIFSFIRSDVDSKTELSFVTQHTMPLESRKWGMECLNTRSPLPTLLCAGYSVKQIFYALCISKC